MITKPCAKIFKSLKGLSFVTSMFMLIVGLLLVLSHNLWNTIEQSLVSFIGKSWDQPAYYRIGGIVWMTIGVFLLMYV